MVSLKIKDSNQLNRVVLSFVSEGKAESLDINVAKCRRFCGILKFFGFATEIKKDNKSIYVKTDSFVKQFIKQLKPEERDPNKLKKEIKKKLNLRCLSDERLNNLYEFIGKHSSVIGKVEQTPDPLGPNILSTSQDISNQSSATPLEDAKTLSITPAQKNEKTLQRLRAIQQSGGKIAVFLGREYHQPLPEVSGITYCPLNCSGGRGEYADDDSLLLDMDFNDKEEMKKLKNLFDEVVVDQSTIKFIEVPQEGDPDSRGRWGVLIDLLREGPNSRLISEVSSSGRLVTEGQPTYDPKEPVITWTIKGRESEEEEKLIESLVKEKLPLHLGQYFDKVEVERQIHPCRPEDHQQATDDPSTLEYLLGLYVVATGVK